MDLYQQCRDALAFLRWRLAERADSEGFEPLFEEPEGYRTTYERVTGRPFGQHECWRLALARGLFA